MYIYTIPCCRVTETTTTMGPVMTHSLAGGGGVQPIIQQGDIGVGNCPPGYGLLVDPKTKRYQGCIMYIIPKLKRPS